MSEVLDLKAQATKDMRVVRAAAARAAGNEKRTAEALTDAERQWNLAKAEREKAVALTKKLTQTRDLLNEILEEMDDGGSVR